MKRQTTWAAALLLAAGCSSSAAAASVCSSDEDAGISVAFANIAYHARLDGTPKTALETEIASIQATRPRIAGLLRNVLDETFHADAPLDGSLHASYLMSVCRLTQERPDRAPLFDFARAYPMLKACERTDDQTRCAMDVAFTLGEAAE